MAILRKIKKDNYTVIDNSVFKDYDLSLKAKGLLCQMLSVSDGWAFSIAGLARCCKDGKDSVSNALKELENAGYFKRVQKKDGNKFDGVEYVVSEVKMTDSPCTENTISRNSDTGIPISKKPPQLNTNKSSTNKSNTKRLSTKFIAPSLEEVAEYVREKNLNVDSEKFYEYYEAGEWHDAKGKPVKNWKQKCITWDKKGVYDIDDRRSDQKRSRVSGATGTGTGGNQGTRTQLPPVEESLLKDFGSESNA